MNDNDKTGNQEQEQPGTHRQRYAHLVLAFSILFSLFVLVGGLYVFQGMIGTAGLFEVKLPAWTEGREMIVAFIFMVLIFFAGAFVFLALKENTKWSAAAGDAVVLVCQILFYPVHVVVRFIIRFCAVVVLLLTLATFVTLGYFLYTNLVPRLEEFAYSFNAFMGTGLAVLLIGVLPKRIMSTASASMKNMDNMIENVSELSLFPEIVVKKVWLETINAAKEIEKESIRFILNLTLLLGFALLAVVSFATLQTATSHSNADFPATLIFQPTSSPVADKTSYIFLDSAPKVAGNRQSFINSAVVFPRDAVPQDLVGDKTGEDAVKLSDGDKSFYAGIYKPLFADWAKCGAPGDPVKIELSGFASSSNSSKNEAEKKIIAEKCSGIVNEPAQSENNKDIKKTTGYNDLFNLCVAQKRAGFVKGMLEDLVREQNNQDVFDFTVKSWASLDQMRTNKIFCDRKGAENQAQTVQGNKKDAQSCRDDGEYDHTRGLMNRRVEVSVIKMPLCE